MEWLKYYHLLQTFVIPSVNKYTVMRKIAASCLLLLNSLFLLSQADCNIADYGCTLDDFTVNSSGIAVAGRSISTDVKALYALLL